MENLSGYIINCQNHYRSDSGCGGRLIFREDAAVLAPLGDLLLSLLTFLIIPLILFTLMVGINQSRLTDLGRMGGKVFLYYVLSSAFAIIVGLTVASLFQPGTGMTLQGNETFDVPENPGIINVLLGIVPSNIFTAFAELNLLGIIFTAFAFGLAIAICGDHQSLAISENTSIKPSTD